MKKELGIFVLLVVLCVVVSLANPLFLSGENLQNMARLVGMYGIFSIGLGLIIITGGIDLSVGSVFALLGVVMSMMLVEWHWPAALAVARKKLRWAAMKAARSGVICVVQEPACSMRS